mgnify:FL=1|tara:strand:+ start:675 stop:914 length:240 start_codon:yes stop_codon:yes gene_type:complete
MRPILKALETAAYLLHLEDEVLDRAHDDIMHDWEWDTQDGDKELRLDEINRRGDQINEALRAINKVIRSCEEESVRRRG